MRDTEEAQLKQKHGEAGEEGEWEITNANPLSLSNLPGQDCWDCGIPYPNVTLHLCVCVCFTLVKTKSNEKEAYKF